MPYNQNIPQPTDQLDVSQVDLLNNFQAIKTLIDINHVTFDAVGQGKHTQVTLPENAAPTNTGAAEGNIYSQESPLTGNTELYWQRENNGTRIEWTGRSNTVTSGWTRLPSGILIKWSTTSINAVDANNGVITVTWPVAATIPAFANQGIAFVNPMADPLNPAKDVNCIAYVYNVGNPLSVSFRLWRRNLFNTIGTDQGPLQVSILAIGV